jgi:hypothetical protein
MKHQIRYVMILTFVDNIKAWAWSDIAHPVNIMLNIYQTIIQYGERINEHHAR